MRIILVGFGTVGQGFAEILRDKADSLSSKQGLDAQIVGVVTGSSGMLYHPDGLNTDALLDAKATGDFANYPASNSLKRDFEDGIDLIQHAQADVLIEASPTNLETAQPAMAYLNTALATGKHVITANKGPIALAYPHLRDVAQSKGLQLRFEATVMAGTPAVATGLEMLAGCTIEKVHGIFNGTTNYILTQMEGGLSYDAALAQAQKLGYAEADPTADVEGWDAASKVLILLATLFDKQLSLSDLDVTGITNITATDIRMALESGARYKLIASADAQGGSVQPTRLSVRDPLAQVSGATNAVTFKTDLMGDITLIGAGAGRKETGYALLADLLAIHRII